MSGVVVKGGYMNDVSNLIKAFCEASDGVRFYPDYSGRFMYGRTCVGISVEDNYVLMLIKLCDFLHCNGIDNVDALISSDLRVDNMGKGMIIYFPQLR